MKIAIHLKESTPPLIIENLESVTCYDGENSINFTAENLSEFRVKSNMDYIFHTDKLNIAMNSVAILYVVSGE